MRIQVIGKEMETISGFFLLNRGFMGSWVPTTALCQGLLAEGDESPWNDKATISSVVHVPTSWYPRSIIWRFICILEENKLNKKIRDTCPKDYMSQGI